MPRYGMLVEIYFLYLDNVNLIDLLIKSGSNVTALDDSRESPLHAAAKHGNSSSLLVECV